MKRTIHAGFPTRCGSKVCYEMNGPDGYDWPETFMKKAGKYGRAGEYELEGKVTCQNCFAILRNESAFPPLVKTNLPHEKAFPSHIAATAREHGKSAVAQALSKLESDKKKTYYWDPYFVDGEWW